MMVEIKKKAEGNTEFCAELREKINSALLKSLNSDTISGVDIK